MTMDHQPPDQKPVGVVLDGAIGLFRASFASVLLLAFASALIRSLPSLYPSWSEILLSSGVLSDSVVPVDSLLQGLRRWLLGFAVTWPVGMFLGLAVIIQMDAVANGGTLGWYAAVHRAWHRLVPMIGCLVVFAATVAVAAGGSLLVGGVVVGAVLLDVPTSAVGLVAGLIGMAVALVAAIPLVAVFVYWCLALPLVATQDIGTVAALRGSWRLVRRNWWRTLVIVSVVGFVVFAVTSLVRIVDMLLVAASDGGAAVRVAAVLLNTAGGTVTTPLFIAALLATLRDLSPQRA